MRYLKILILASFALLSDLNLSAQANAHIASMNPILNDVTRSVQPTTVRTSQVTNLSQGRSLRPEIRRIKEQAAPQKEIILVQVSTTKDNASFTYWLRSFKARARSKGISQHIIEKAFDGVRYEAKTIKSDRNQAEFVKTIWDYLDSAVSSPRIAGGKVALHKHRTTFDAVEAKYGVEREVIAAIWGLESTYGELRGNKNII
jgi:membrane-bound lytic murein transglycosylase B